MQRMRLLAARPIAVASYASAAAATAVRNALDGQHCLRLGRVLRVEYARDSAIPALFAAPAASVDASKPTAVPGMCVAAEDVKVSGLLLKRDWISQQESEYEVLCCVQPRASQSLSQ